VWLTSESSYMDRHQRQQVASSIDLAFRSVGFVYLQNHSITQKKVDDCFEWVRSTSCFLTPTRH